MKRLFKHPQRTNYGQRWQSETIISMIKRDLGDAIHARRYWRQCRELMLLAVTHNVRILLPLKVFYGALPTPFPDRSSPPFPGSRTRQVESYRMCNSWTAWRR